MTDARPTPTFPTTSGALAASIGAELLGAADIVIDAVESSERARPGVLTFARSAKFVRVFLQSPASAALVSADAMPKDPAARQLPEGKAILVVPNADLAIVALLDALTPRARIEPGVHPSAIIARDAIIAPTARIEAHVVVESGVTIGERSSIGAGCVIGRGCRIGEGTILYPRVVLYPSVFVGDRCLIHAGCVLGADGFGFIPAPGGRGLVKIPHVGSVEIHDDVEIGSNTTIDRGKFGATVIGHGTKIDNLCQIGHNCRIGRMCIICGMSGLAGSVVLGDGVIVGAKGGIADNISLGAGSKLAGGSNARENMPAGETWMGHHARPVMENLRSLAAYQKLGETTSSLRTANKQLERRIEALDEELRSLRATLAERGKLHPAGGHAGGRHD